MSERRKHKSKRKPYGLLKGWSYSDCDSFIETFVNKKFARVLGKKDIAKQLKESTND